MVFKNMTIYQFLILSLIIIDGSLASVIMFSNIEEVLKFIGLIMMFVSSMLIIMIGAYNFAKQNIRYRKQQEI